MTGPGELRSLRGTREPVTTISSSACRGPDSASGGVCSPNAVPEIPSETTRTKGRSRKATAAPKSPSSRVAVRDAKNNPRRSTRTCRLLDHAVEHRPQGSGGNRLRQEIVHAGREAGLPIRLPGSGRHGDHVQVSARVPLALPDGLDHLETIDLRQVHIEEQGVERG